MASARCLAVLALAAAAAAAPLAATPPADAPLAALAAALRVLDRPGAPPAPNAVQLSASDPLVLPAGRTVIDGAGSRVFDWEGVSFYFDVNATHNVFLNMTCGGGTSTRVSTHAFFSGAWMPLTRVWALPGDNSLLIASSLGGAPTPLRVFFELEPAMTGAAGGGALAVHSFGLDAGAHATPRAPLARRIEVVGDSISAGYGALAAAGECAGDALDSSNLASWNQRVCEQFAANCSIVAWSGKGMYENCCDAGITMRDLYLQTRGGTPYSADWDFASYVPDVLIINLGTNDFGHDNGTAWEAAFTATYVSFVRNATARYGNAALPVFVAQGNMNRGPALQAALAAAIAGINGAGGNATFLDLRVGPNDGCGGHPGVAGHAAMAAAAAPVISRVMGW